MSKPVLSRQFPVAQRAPRASAVLAPRVSTAEYNATVVMTSNAP